MSFRGMLRPGQGAREFAILRRKPGVSKTGRPQTEFVAPVGSFFGIISQASPREAEQWKQRGTPITHTIVQRGAKSRAKATDILRLSEKPPRFFLVQGEPHDPGELGHFLVYHVEERSDLP